MSYRKKQLLAERAGPPKRCTERRRSVLKRLSPCVPRPVTPTDSPHLAGFRCFGIGFHDVERVAVRFKAIRGRKWSSGGTNSLWPTWYSVYTSYNSFDACPNAWSVGSCFRACYCFGCACFGRTSVHLLLIRKTRYRWMASPYRIWTSR